MWPLLGIGFRANQNAVPHGSHRNCDLIIPFPAMTWPPGLICSLWHEGHRRSWITGNSDSGGLAIYIPTLTSMMASERMLSLLGARCFAKRSANSLIFFDPRIEHGGGRARGAPPPPPRL